MTTIALRWAGPSDANDESTYRIERATSGLNWTLITANDPSTAPYAAVHSTLAATVAYGATSLSLVSASAFPSSGFGWLEDALILWTGKTGNTLTGLTWLSGYGTYFEATLYHANEHLEDSVVITNNAVLYRIFHQNEEGFSSAPTYLWYYSPPPPASSDHCVLIVQLLGDLGLEFQVGQPVAVELVKDTDFTSETGAHLDAASSSGRTVLTNPFGLAFFQLWRSSSRSPLLASASGYRVILNPGSSQPLSVLLSEIPDQDFVFLSQVASSLE